MVGGGGTGRCVGRVPGGYLQRTEKSSGGRGGYLQEEGRGLPTGGLLGPAPLEPSPPAPENEDACPMGHMYTE